MMPRATGDGRAGGRVRLLLCALVFGRAGGARVAFPEEQAIVSSEARAAREARAPLPPPWWVVLGVTPEGPSVDMGTWARATFSQAQLEHFGVGEHGEVLDQARFDAAVAALKALASAANEPAVGPAAIPKLAVAEERPEEAALRRAPQRGGSEERPAARDVPEGSGPEGFSCPGFCQECCTVSPSGHGVPHALGFRCVLRSPASGLPAGCANSSEDGSAVCPYSAEDRKREVWKSAPSLQWGCSKRLRCCCSTTGLAMCTGDVTPKERLVEAYNLSVNELPALSDNGTAMARYDSTRWGCGPGLSDYDVSGRLCRCSGACGSAARVPEAPPRGSPSDPLDVQMASLAAGVYVLESPVAGWEMVKAWDTTSTAWRDDHDIAGIYRKKLNGGSGPYTCALAFSGTDSPGDALKDLEEWTTDFCGFSGVHWGFAKTAQKYTSGPRSKEFLQYLIDPSSCGGGVFATGHSMGGAVATLIAACHNQLVNGTSVQGFDGLYTFAAPAPSQQPLENALSKDGSGCFSGGRFFYVQPPYYDIIPGIATYCGFAQPKLTQVKVEQQIDGVLFMSHSCNYTSAGILQDPVYGVQNVSSGLEDNLKLHVMGVYIENMLSHYHGQ